MARDLSSKTDTADEWEGCLSKLPTPALRRFWQACSAGLPSSGLGTGIALLAWFFPYDTDAPKTADEMAKEQEYYGKAFAASDRTLIPDASADSAEDERYVKIGEKVAQAYHIEERLQTFVSKYGLAGKKALDVGSGRGYLQDVVEDYTGLDISPTAARFYHKKFVLGSATSMPFEPDSFDVVWSIDVLEHVPNPEQALREIRRVAKDGALLYLLPAWDCQPYLADGYNVRPYSDFGLGGKLIKAAIPRASRRMCSRAWPSIRPDSRHGRGPVSRPRSTIIGSRPTTKPTGDRMPTPSTRWIATRPRCGFAAAATSA